MAHDPERQRLNNQHNALKRWVAELEQKVDSDGRVDPVQRARLIETKYRLHSAELARKVLEARRARELAEQLEAEIQNDLIAAAGGVA